MSIILLADDSPHAQRMGERILREEGFEVVSVTNGETALVRMFDVDPDLVIADAFLPGCNGFDLCRKIKASHRHVRVILTAGLLETFDEEEARRSGADAVLKKPFEASVVMQTIRPLINEAQLARGLFAEVMAAQLANRELKTAGEANTVNGLPVASKTSTASPEAERIEAAITLALDAALPALIREITEKVLVALGH
jgi:DNA-binding response OmpR family regulator